MKEKEIPTAEQILVITAIAKFMGYAPFTVAQWENYEAEGVHNMYLVDYRTNYHNDWNLLMEVVEKLEKFGWFILAFEFTDDETGNGSSEYWAQIDRTLNVSIDSFVNITGCSSKLEATFKAIGKLIPQLL